MVSPAKEASTGFTEEVGEVSNHLSSCRHFSVGESAYICDTVFI